MSVGPTAPGLDEILRLIEKGMAKVDIARHLGMGRATVFTRLREAGLSPEYNAPEPEWPSNAEFEEMNRKSAELRRRQPHGIGASSLAGL